MAGISLIVTGAVLVIALFAGNINGEHKIHWPNLGCHPANPSEETKSLSTDNRNWWFDKLGLYEKDKRKNCPFSFILIQRRIMWRNSSEGPMFFDVDDFITKFVKEIGEGKAQNAIVKKITSGLEDCKLKNPQFKEIRDDWRGPCSDKWMDIVKCVDKAVGCPGMDYSLFKA